MSNTIDWENTPFWDFDRQPVFDENGCYSTKDMKRPAGEGPAKSS